MLLLLSVYCPGVGCFPYLVTGHLVHKTVCSRLETLHATWLKKTSCVHLIPHGSGACVLIMEARLVVSENRLKRTEEVLVMERLAQRFAESAQQMVGTQSAGIEKSLGATGLVGAKETGQSSS